MTIYTLEGITLHYGMTDQNDVIAVGQESLETTIPDGQDSLSYAIIGDFSSYDGNIALDTFPELKLGESYYGDKKVDLFIADLAWGADNNTRILMIEGDDGKQDWIFRLSGDALPDIATPDDWFAFEDSITVLTEPDGAPIVLDSIPDLQVADPAPAPQPEAPEEGVTYAIGGTTLLYGVSNQNDVIGAEESLLELTFAEPLDELPYTILPDYDGYDSDVVFDVVPQEIRLGGVSYDLGELDIYMAEVEWGEGRSATLLMMEADADLQEWIFRVEGDALPEIETPSDFFALEGIVTRFDGPDGTPIDLSAVPGIEVLLPADAPLVGGDDDDRLEGTEADDVLEGGGGADGLIGGAGNDTLRGGEGDDNLAASDGNDVLEGGAGADLMGGGFGDDHMDGGIGNDFMGGGLGNDTVLGGDGNDVVNAGAGNDELSGGEGSDTMGASFGDDIIDGGTGDDSMGGGAGKDVLTGGTGADSIGAGEGDDVVHGEGGDDFLAGGGRHDEIHGGAGADTINGGAGDDTMTGGADGDEFVFNELVDGETDVILGFEDGLDSFRLTGVQNAPGSGLAGYVDALDITDTTVEGEAGVSMSYNGHTILVQGVGAADLTVDDFTFLL